MMIPTKIFAVQCSSAVLGLKYSRKEDKNCFNLNTSSEDAFSGGYRLNMTFKLSTMALVKGNFCVSILLTKMPKRYRRHEGLYSLGKLLAIKWMDWQKDGSSILGGRNP